MYVKKLLTEYSKNRRKLIIDIIILLKYNVLSYGEGYKFRYEIIICLIAGDYFLNNRLTA